MTNAIQRHDFSKPQGSSLRRAVEAPLRRVAGLLAALACLVAVAPASSEADSAEGYGRPGGYVSAGGAVALQSFDLDISGFSFDQAGLIGGRIGYRGNPYIAVEGAVDYSVKGFEASAETGRGRGSLESKAVLATANVKLYPGGWRIQPFALVGAGLIHATLDCSLDGVSFACGEIGLSDNETAFAARVGGGVEAYLTPNIALAADVSYVIPTGEIDAFRFVTIGGQLVFRF